MTAVDSETTEITKLLINWRKGDRKALDKLMPLVYEELRIIARSRLKHERRDHSFRTDVLVNETYLKFTSNKEPNCQDRVHFFGIAARLMRQILVDYAREHSAEKRGGNAERIYVDDIDGFSKERNLDLIKLDQALVELEQKDKRKAMMVEIRYFGGLTIEETAQVLELSVASLKREWNFAKAFLLRSLDNGGR